MTVAGALLPTPVQTTADLLLRWPTSTPLAALVSGGAGAHNAWTILAAPTETIVLDGAASEAETLDALSRALARTPRMAPSSFARDDASAHEPPFQGGWMVALGYDLGRCFEPRAVSARSQCATPCTRAVLQWCADAICIHHASGTVVRVGSPPELLPELSHELSHELPHEFSHAPVTPPWQLEPLAAQESDAQFGDLVMRTREAIHAGDIFQANISRRFHARLHGSARAFAHAAITRNEAWFGAFMDLPDGGALVSMSPELFLRVTRDGEVVTRPIKGTRSADVAASELNDSSKDAAELAMIVDLMRNDLGRVAAIGSVRVTEGRVMETHRTVHHGVAEVRAQLRSDASWMDLLRATFPPGSVTGAPKIRAMQLIDELEESPRGFYCGAIGFISRSGHAALNVAIRTAQLAPAEADNSRHLHYHAGCGIVAESEAVSEIAESHAKARAIRQLATPLSKSAGNA